jgi:UDP-N-acetyl-D-mannosaminuronic acid dehydrogenase
LKYGLETYGRRPSGETLRQAQGDAQGGVHRESGVLRLIPLAREIDDGMPEHMLDLIEDALDEAGRELDGAKVALLGVAYLEDADDTRNTPAATLAGLLLERGAGVVAHDPYVRQADWQQVLDDACGVPLTKNLEEALADADCAAVVTRHREYVDLVREELGLMMRTPIFVDGRNVLSGSSEEVLVRAVGRGNGAGGRRAGERRSG